MAFALAQTVKTNATGAAGSTRAVTVSAVGTGNLLIIAAAWGSGSALTSSSPTATGLTFTQIGTDVANGTNTRCAAWYAKNTTSGATTVTFNLSGSATFLDAYVLEFTGADTTAPLRTNQSGTGSSATASTAALTVTVGDLIYGFGNTPSTTATNMGVLDSNADGGGLGHTLSAASTSITPTFTTGSGTWAMVSAAFIPAGGGGATAVPLLSMMGLGT